MNSYARCDHDRFLSQERTIVQVPSSAVQTVELDVRTIFPTNFCHRVRLDAGTRDNAGVVPGNV